MVLVLGFVLLPTGIGLWLERAAGQAHNGPARCEPEGLKLVVVEVVGEVGECVVTVAVVMGL